MNAEQICYKNNYVKNVVLKIDFQDFDLLMTSEITNSITTILPLYEKRLEKHVQINLQNGEAINKAAEAANHVFSSENRSFVLTISELQKAIWFETITYNTWNEYYSMFISLSKILEQNIKMYSINRIGLRFINQIPFKNYIDIRKSLSKNISTIFTENSKEKEMSRLLVIKDLTFEDSFFRFQFGMPNQYFPNPILVPEFVLDFDAYSNKIRCYEELGQLIETFHSQIQNEFEKSITDEFRKLMGIK